MQPRENRRAEIGTEYVKGQFDKLSLKTAPQKRACPFHLLLLLLLLLLLFKAFSQYFIYAVIFLMLHETFLYDSCPIFFSCICIVIVLHLCSCVGFLVGARAVEVACKYYYYMVALVHYTTVSAVLLHLLFVCTLRCCTETETY